MNSSPFRVLPWEYGGTLPAPSQIIEARVDDQLRRFEVKWRDGRAFFRLADADDKRVWASWDCIGESEFARAVEAGRVGRLMLVSRGFSVKTLDDALAQEFRRRFHPSDLDLMGPTTLAVIVGDEYQGRAQEWCGSDWLDFDLPPRRPIRSGARKPSIWHRGWNVVGLRGALSTLGGALAFRAFEPNPRDSQPLHFVCGSEEKLRELLTAAHLIWSANYARQAYRTGATTRQARAMNVNFVIAAENGCTTAIKSYRGYLPADLVGAFIEHNLPVGGQWQKVANKSAISERLVQFVLEKSLARLGESAKQRMDYRFTAEHVHFPIEIPRHPSAHEQLEARLLLRNWMRETLPAAQFEKLKKYVAA